MRRYSTSIFAVLAVAACGSDEPPTPTEVRASIHDDLHYILTEGKGAAQKSTTNLPTTSILSIISPSLVLDDPMSTLDEMQPDELTTKLETELFTDANYLGAGIFKVPASLVCKETIYNDDGTTTEQIDPDCATQLDKLQVRIRVASEDDAIRFFLQVDANHDEPLSLLLAPDRLAVTVNLDDATDAMIAFAAIEGEAPPNADLSGSVTGSLTILGAGHAKVALSFDRAISVKVADAGIALDSDAATRFTSAAAQVISVELDGNAPKAKLDVGLGETTAHIPGDSVDPSQDILLGGATVNATYQGNTLSLDHISLGDKQTKISVGGQVAQTIDLNATSGRSLDATITGNPATGEETLTVSPRLDLQMTVDHGLLGDELPTYDVTRVLLDGSLRGIADTDQIEVVSGTLSMTTNPAQYGFAAAAGQCVSSTYETDPVTYEDYETYSVGACL
jgi:hypothetical protein